MCMSLHRSKIKQKKGLEQSNKAQDMSGGRLSKDWSSISVKRTAAISVFQMILLNKISYKRLHDCLPFMTAGDSEDKPCSCRRCS